MALPLPSCRYCQLVCEFLKASKGTEPEDMDEAMRLAAQILALEPKNAIVPQFMPVLLATKKLYSKCFVLPLLFFRFLSRSRGLLLTFYTVEQEEDSEESDDDEEETDDDEEETDDEEESNDEGEKSTAHVQEALEWNSSVIVEGKDGKA